MTQAQDPFDILGLTPNASKEEIRDAFLRLSRRVHSDQGGTDALFRQVKWAYDELKDRPESGSNGRQSQDHRSEETGATSKPSSAHTNGPGGSVGSSGLVPWVNHNPSWFLLILGIGFLIVAGASHSSPVFGLLVTFGGLSGVTGIKPAATYERFRNSNIYVLDTMTGVTFEKFLMSMFAREGYDVKLTNRTGDFGADLILRRGDHKTVVQAKRYAGNVGLDAVQEVAGARAHYKANEAMVVTNSHYTTAARALAKSNSVVLMEREDLVVIMARQSGIQSMSGWDLFRKQLRYGIPRLVRHILLILVGVLGVVASISESGNRKRRRRRRW